MSSRGTSRTPLVVLTAALLGVGLWSVSGGRSDLWSQRAAVESAIEYHEAIVGEVLRIDAGSRWSFDTLSTLERGLRSRIDRLTPATQDDPSGRLPELLRTDLELVERYKTHHAVRRKSLDVLSNPEAAPTQLPDLYSATTHKLLTRLTAGRDRRDAAEAIRGVLQDERWRDPRHADAKSHLRLVVQSQTRCDAIVDRLVQSPAHSGLLDVSERLRDQIEANTAGLESRQQIMLVLLAASLGYAGAMLLEQRKTVRELARTNDGLELAVAERTSELSAERELLQSLLNSLPSAVFWKDLDGVYRGGNPAFIGMLGLDEQQQLIGVTDDELPWDPESRKRKIETERSVLRSHKPIIEKPVSKSLRSGHSYEMIASKTILRDQQGRARGLVGVYTDVTELNRLRDELAQAEKLRSVGQLAAGIAHEINSPLQAASVNIEYLKASIGSLLSVAVEGVSEALSDHQETEANRLEDVRRNADGAIEDSSEALRRVTEIVSAMRVMSHPGKQRHEATDLNVLLQSAVTLTRNRWKYAAELEVDADPDLPLADVLTNEMSQVLLNLIVNAGDAIAESRDEGDPLGLVIVRTRSDDDHVVVEIEDNGCGMPPEVRERIFEPFFTTKDVGKGTGQGLAIVHDVVVEGHDGQIECDSEPGVGTTFRVRLPIVATRTGDAAAAC